MPETKWLGSEVTRVQLYSDHVWVNAPSSLKPIFISTKAELPSASHFLNA